MSKTILALSITVISLTLALAYTATNKTRTKLSSNTTWYVNPSMGNDNNSGLTPKKPKKHIQAAWDTIHDHYDAAGFKFFIQLQGGTPEAPAEIKEQVTIYDTPVGANQVTISGDPERPTSYLWHVSKNQIAIAARDKGIVSIKGFKFIGDQNAIAMQASQLGVIDFANIDFGSFPSGQHIQVMPGGTVNALTGYTISGGAQYHIFLLGQATFTQEGASSINLPNKLLGSWTSGEGFDVLYKARAFSILSFGQDLTYVGIGANNGIAAIPYAITEFAVAYFNGAKIPGDKEFILNNAA